MNKLYSKLAELLDSLDEDEAKEFNRLISTYPTVLELSIVLGKIKRMRYEEGQNPPMFETATKL